MFNIIEETRKDKSKFVYDDLEDVIYSIEYYLDEHDRTGE